MKIAVLLPTYNEEESIAAMIQSVRMIDESYDIYVVDSGSTDQTVRIAQLNCANIISLDERGKGLAIAKAFRELDYDAIVMLDSDMSYSPEDIPLLLKGLKDNDVVVGSRFIGEIQLGAMSGLNRFGNRLLTGLAVFLFGIPTTDVCSGFWAFMNDAYKSMEIDARHFPLEANFYVECLDKELCLGEVPIHYGVRRGQSKLGMIDGLEIGLYLIKRWLL